MASTTLGGLVIFALPVQGLTEVFFHDSGDVEAHLSGDRLVAAILAYMNGLMIQVYTLTCTL